MQHIRSLCTRLAEHAKDRVKLGEILLNSRVGYRHEYRKEKRRKKSVGSVATVAIGLHQLQENKNILIFINVLL